MTITQGHRLYPTDKDKIFETMKLIDYFKLSSGEFIICTPNNLIASIRNHTVIEHENGTISVSPSILINGTGTWHGFLEKGIWREI